MTTEDWTFADYRLGDTVLPEPNLGWNMYGTGLKPGSTGVVRCWGLARPPERPPDMGECC